MWRQHVLKMERKIDPRSETVLYYVAVYLAYSYTPIAVAGLTVLQLHTSDICMCMSRRRSHARVGY